MASRGLTHNELLKMLAEPLTALAALNKDVSNANWLLGGSAALLFLGLILPLLFGVFVPTVTLP
jgi:hypothetical protein